MPSQNGDSTACKQYLSETNFDRIVVITLPFAAFTSLSGLNRLSGTQLRESGGRPNRACLPPTVRQLRRPPAFSRKCEALLTLLCCHLKPALRMTSTPLDEFIVLRQPVQPPTPLRNTAIASSPLQLAEAGQPPIALLTSIARRNPQRIQPGNRKSSTNEIHFARTSARQEYNRVERGVKERFARARREISGQNVIERDRCTTSITYNFTRSTDGESRGVHIIRDQRGHAGAESDD